MGLIRICLLLVPMIAALALFTRRSTLEAAPMLLLGIAALGYVLSLFTLQAAGTWLLRGLWLAAVLYLGVQINQNRKRYLFSFDFSLLLLLAGFIFLWWIDRGRQFTIWDEFSHWGMAAKSLFREGRLVSLVSGSGDNFAEYPPALAPFSYLVLSAVGYGFREDLVLYMQSVFLLALMWYPLHLCPPKKNPVVFCGGAVLLFLVPLVCYPYSYTGILVDCLLGVMGGFLVLAAAFSRGSRWDIVFCALAAFVLSSAVKSTGIVFALPGCLLFLLPRGEKKAFRSRFAPFSLLPLAAAAAGKASWGLFCFVYHISARSSGAGFSAAALGQLFTGYRAEVLKKFFANIFADFNYGSFLHFPYLFWPFLLAVAYAVLSRAVSRTKNESRPATRYGFWFSWVFLILFTLSVLFSYLFLFAEGEAVALASLSRYLNSPLTMLLFVSAAMLCLLLSRFNWKHQLAGISAALIFWAEGTSPSSFDVLHDLAAAPVQAGESVNFNRSYRTIADWIASSDDPDAASLYLVSQQDFGFAYIAMNYQLFPATIPDQLSSISSHAGADATYTNYETPEAWADMLAADYHYLCLHSIDETFVSDFGGLFDDPAQLQNGAVFRIEPQADGSVHFTPAATLVW